MSKLLSLIILKVLRRPKYGRFRVNLMQLTASLLVFSGGEGPKKYHQIR